MPSGKRVLHLQIQLRLQRPTVVAEIGFMLAVTKFFVPGVTMSGVTPTPFESNDVVLEGKPCATPLAPLSPIVFDFSCPCMQLCISASGNMSSFAYFLLCMQCFCSCLGNINPTPLPTPCWLFNCCIH